MDAGHSAHPEPSEPARRGNQKRLMMRKFGFMRQVNKRVERVVKIKGLRLFAIAGTSRAGRARLVPSSRALVYRGG